MEKEVNGACLDNRGNIYIETTRRYFGLTGSADSKQVSNKTDGVDTLQSCFMTVPLMEIDSQDNTFAGFGQRFMLDAEEMLTSECES